jgi:hypothetical protein
MSEVLVADTIVEEKSPILNKPFEEPIQHWRRSDDNALIEVIPTRRPAGYDYKSEAQGRLSFAIEENYVELTLVNLLRSDVM